MENKVFLPARSASHALHGRDLFSSSYLRNRKTPVEDNRKRAQTESEVQAPKEYGVPPAQQLTEEKPYQKIRPRTGDTVVETEL